MKWKEKKFSIVIFYYIQPPLCGAQRGVSQHHHVHSTAAIKISLSSRKDSRKITFSATD